MSAKIWSRILSSPLLYRNIKIKTNVVLYGCETWCLTLREEHRLRVFEIWVLRRIFGPKRDEVTGVMGKKKLHNTTVIIYYWSDEIKQVKMGWACGTYGGEAKCVQSFDEET